MIKITDYKIRKKRSTSWYSCCRKVEFFFNIIIGSFIGVFIGHGIYVYLDYKAHPDLYAMQSAPWYTSIFVYGVVMLILLVVLAIAKLIIRKKNFLIRWYPLFCVFSLHKKVQMHKK